MGAICAGVLALTGATSPVPGLEYPEVETAGTDAEGLEYPAFEDASGLAFCGEVAIGAAGIAAGFEYPLFELESGIFGEAAIGGEADGFEYPLPEIVGDEGLLYDVELNDLDDEDEKLLPLDLADDDPASTGLLNPMLKARTISDAIIKILLDLNI